MDVPDEPEGTAEVMLERMLREAGERGRRERNEAEVAEAEVHAAMAADDEDEQRYATFAEARSSPCRR